METRRRNSDTNVTMAEATAENENKRRPSLEKEDIASKKIKLTEESVDNSEIDNDNNDAKKSPEETDENHAEQPEVQKLISNLDPLPPTVKNPLMPLSPLELQELEAVLEFGHFNQSSDEGGWRNDWGGNLAYVDKDILSPFFRVKNPKFKIKSVGPSRGRKATDRMSLLQWLGLLEESAANAPKAAVVRRLIHNLFRHVCTHDYGGDETVVHTTVVLNNDEQMLASPGAPTSRHHHHHKVPESVTKLLSMVEPEKTNVSKIEAIVRRASYDPQILKEDGWTIVKSAETQGATGGPYRIGDKIRYDGSDAVVIAYVHDSDIGDLWKAIWVEDFVAFDLEAEELLQAKKKWERNNKKPDSGGVASSNAARRKPARAAAAGASGSIDFTVKGIQYGIVLAASYAKGARPGVYWPARVMHASENAGSTARRSSSKTQKKVDIVFLAPYWNSIDETQYSRGNSTLSENQESVFQSSPLLQLETVDATDEMIKEYPYGDEEGGASLDLQQLRMSFRFTGLPKSAFSRFLDSHRLALALREFAKTRIEVKDFSEDVSSLRATAALFEAHPMTVQAPLFPTVVLHLPFSFLLSELSTRKDKKQDDSGKPSYETRPGKEPAIKLSCIVDCMKPPQCWGEKPPSTNGNGVVTKTSDNHLQQSSDSWLHSLNDKDGANLTDDMDKFISEFPSLSEVFNRFNSSPSLAGVIKSFHVLLQQISNETQKKDANSLPNNSRNADQESLINSWAVIKRMGEDALVSLSKDAHNSAKVISDWRKATEGVFKYMIRSFAENTTVVEGSSPIATAVISDFRCNEHLTSAMCLERRVRLPAALKGARRAGAKPEGPVRLITSISDDIIDYVEKELLRKAHSIPYLKRMKNRCTAATTNSAVLKLTDDSDGNGGEDTRGSQGTWTAAVCAVAAAVKATNMIVRGECVNAFCATRPPGHHAGRSLHPMKAISNGFCILNPAACAAIHATTPVAEGGLGLSRACVIDFDVHHGNGTQDILCSTYDPRFLYVSLHAGGSHINGLPPSEDPNDEPYGLAKNPKLSGIYPGRCGDKSPHKGVLNIPLGTRVFSHAVGTALLQRVTPAVEEFSPDVIILSAGFDAHKNDPMGLGGLSAEDFGNITEVACQLAFKSCSGRILSIMEGGYGVPCCRPQDNTFLPPGPINPSSAEMPSTTENAEKGGKDAPTAVKLRPQPSKLLDLGEDLPAEMDDQVPLPLQTRLEKCHAEGFVECVYEHVASLIRCNKRN